MVGESLWLPTSFSKSLYSFPRWKEPSTLFQKLEEYVGSVEHGLPWGLFQSKGTPLPFSFVRILCIIGHASSRLVHAPVVVRLRLHRFLHWIEALSWRNPLYFRFQKTWCWCMLCFKVMATKDYVVISLHSLTLSWCQILILYTQYHFFVCPFSAHVFVHNLICAFSNLSVSFSCPLSQSIDPGQQFTWENSNMEVNKPKNRYANVIAYDHSRVVLTPVDGKNSCKHLSFS